MQSRFRPYLPHVVAVVLFMVLALVYMSPLLSGKVLVQGDVTQFENSAHEVLEYKKKTGEYSMWTNSMFSGMPSYLITGSPTKSYIGHMRQPNIPQPADQVFLLMLGGYVLMLTFGVNPWLSLVGATAMCFASYNFICMEAGHVTKVYAIAYIPFMLAGIKLLFKRKWLWGALLTSVATGLEVNSNHIQITYYFFMCMGIWVIVEFIYALRNKTLKPFFIALLIAAPCMGLGVAMNATTLMLTEEYSHYTMRGGSELTPVVDTSANAPLAQTTKNGGLTREYAFQWSQGWGELFTIIIPNLYGSGSNVDLGTNSAVYKAIGRNSKEVKNFVEHFPYAYWGDMPFTSGPVYYGAIICFLFVLGLFILKGPAKWWLVVSSVFSLLLSLGSNFELLSYFFYDYFPMYNKFRSVNMIAVVGQVCFALMATLTLKELFFGTHTREQLQAALKKAAGITGGLCLLFLVFGGAFLDFTSPRDAQQIPDLAQALKEDRQSLMTSDAIRSLVFILLAGAALWFFTAQKLKRQYAIAIIGVLILADLWMVDRRMLNGDNFESKRAYANQWTPSPADVEILKDTSVSYRVFDVSSRNAFQNAKASYFHKSIGGYHAAKLSRYQDLIERQIVRNNMRVINMLNTKYLIDIDQNTNQPFAQLNPYALGNAWYIKQIRVVPNPDAEMDSLTRFDPATTAIADQRFASYLGNFSPVYDSTATVVLTECVPNRLNYTTQAASEQFVVFSEIYYEKGWQAYLDGQPVDHIRVDYVLRGMKIPAGKHQIEFRFEPKTFDKGERITGLSSLIVLGLLLAAIADSVLRKRKQKHTGKQEPPASTGHMIS